ncbi:MAG: PhoH family protein [Candidatus Omnitrophota bacterium]
MKKNINIDSHEEAKILFGRHDENIKIIEKELTVQIITRGETLTVKGKEKEVNLAIKLITELIDFIRTGSDLKHEDIICALNSQGLGKKRQESDLTYRRINVMGKKQFTTPKTPGQSKYVDAIRESDITFCIGPAGTGKTYLAVAMAISALKAGEVNRIVLTRPAIEAGESLGFLPGDLSEKITPYLRPVYDALYEMMDQDKVENYLERNIIEIAPLAYMRGRTLNDSFIVLDEAQNSTQEQMKMFLTRLGFDSKTVITGDITQVDLPVNKKSGLLQAQKILKGINGISFTYLTDKDVIRHKLVKEIIKAYAQLDHSLKS